MIELNQLVRHSITPPAFDERNSIHRDRLVDAIHANIPRKLIAIAAPAGYGKTTLLADFGAHTDLTICWMRLTEADWDVTRFAHVLAASLQRRFRRLRGQPDMGALVNSSPEALATAFTSLIKERVAETFVIAFDDVHLVNKSKHVLAFLDRFLERLPEQVTVVAAGREVLEVSFARLMAEHNLAGLGPHDLALTREELAELTRSQHGATLSDQELDHLLEESRGWVTGVVMSGAISEGGLGSIMNPERPMIYEYLAAVVLNRQPHDLHRFALDSSVLPVMTAEACNQVLQRKDSQRNLSRLVRKGLFVTATDHSPRTYEYHPLFRRFLLDALGRSDKRRLRTLRLRAANFYAKFGSPEHAFELFVQAGAKRNAASIASKSSESMLRMGRIETLQRWAETLQELQVGAPQVSIFLGYGHLDRGDFASAESALNAATRALGSGASRTLMALAEALRGYIALRTGDFREVRRAAENAEQLLPKRALLRHRATCLRLKTLAIVEESRDLEEAKAYASEAVNLLERGSDKYSLAMCLIDLAGIQTASGEALEADPTYLRAHELLKEIGSPVPLALSFNSLASNFHRQGKFTKAMEFYIKGLQCARHGASAIREATILLGQADLFNDLGLGLQSAELYGHALSILMPLDDVPLIRYSCLQTSALHRRRGGAGLAHEWLKRALVLEKGKDVPANIKIQLAALETEAAPEQAIQTLKSLIRRGPRKLKAQDLTQVHYFLARASLRFGDEERALQSLGQALTVAGTYGTEQAIAAEMRFDDGMREFATDQIGANPTLSVILSRIDTMRALGRRYERVEEEPGKFRMEIEALGSARVLINGQELRDLKPLAREMLFYLVDHDGVRRGQLMEAFWPDLTEGRQVSNLHTAIYSIRREVGKHMLAFDGSLYRLDSEAPVEYDVARFERAALVAESLPPGDPRRMFALTEAVSSYGGEFLPESDSEWVDERRRSLELRYLDLLASYSEESLMGNQPLEAVNSLREALRIDPLRDDTNRYYLEALAQLGRRSEIVAHYQQYVRALSQELGLDPPQSVRELYTRAIG